MAVPPDVAAWLKGLSLEAYAAPLCSFLGVGSLADVAYVDGEHLLEIGMRPVERAKFLREAAALQPQSPHSPPPPTPPVPAFPLARVRALVVGCDSYGAPLSALANPVADARALGAALRRLPAASVTEVHNPGRAELLRALRDFSDAGAPPVGAQRGMTATPAAAHKGMKVTAAAAAAAPATESMASAADSSQRTLGLFFFSGHGLQVNGENFLVPADFALPASRPRLDDVEDGCVKLDEVLRKMQYGGFFVTVVALDCCRNVPNFLPDAHKSVGGDGALGRGLAEVRACAPAADDAGGMLLAFATSPGDVALDASTRRPGNSPFTAALLSFLEPAAAAPPPSLLSLTTHLVTAVRGDTAASRCRTPT